MIARATAALSSCALAMACSTMQSDSAEANSSPISGRSSLAITVPDPDCEVHVGYDRDTTLSGYLILDERGTTSCVPFSRTAHRPPPNYRGDYYVDEFTDEKLRQRWLSCKENAVCPERLEKHVNRRLPPNREYWITDPHARFLLGKLDERPGLDLAEVRRPGFFARPPYREPIAEVDPDTFTIEFTVRPGPYELRHGMADPVSLRGWYMRGSGVSDGTGGRRRALILMSGGGGTRMAAIQHPDDELFHIDPATGRSVLNDYPNDTTGASGQRGWRQFMYEWNRAGFDVLAYDRRGVGLSGGYVDTNTLQQGRDILTVLGSLRSGAGIRVLTPDGQTLSGLGAVAALGRNDEEEDLPVILAGNSRGTMATGWAMQRNFDQTCSFDATPIVCDPAVGLKSIKGAMMLADFTAGPGYGILNTSQDDRDRALFIGANEVEHGLVFFPSSAILASVHRWPALFIGRGTYDYSESLEGAIDAYRRVSGAKELAVVQGAHPFETWPETERKRISERMIAFATALVQDKAAVEGGRPWTNMRDLVATTANGEPGN